MNNSIFGFTFQKLICDKYNLDLSDRANEVFCSSFDNGLKDVLSPFIDNIFSAIGLFPIECTTLKYNDISNEYYKYNFILSDNSTLSIRTTFASTKVAPREVGQAGFEKLNLYFKDIYGKQILNQDDIKHLVTENIHKILPTFFDFLLDADYVIWFYKDKDTYKYHIIKRDSDLGIEFKRNKFSFTRNYEDWVESTTLKYENISLAEIQVHKNRSFKFRFVMSNLLKLIIEKEKNSETLGITAEKTICDMFNIEYPLNFFKRYSVDLEYQLSPIIMYIFEQIPLPIKHTGSEKGERGKNSKCSYDFLLQGNKTLSLKTNTGKMVCPSEVGQPGAETCYEYFKDYIDAPLVTKDSFKNMVFNHICELIPIYVSHLFDTDYLVRIYEAPKEDQLVYGEKYSYGIFEKDFGTKYEWKKENFSFSKKTLEEWNESNTVYYKGIPLGEFQVHSNRNCFKFRFNFKNFVKIVNEL